MKKTIIKQLTFLLLTLAGISLVLFTINFPILKNLWRESTDLKPGDTVQIESSSIVTIQGTPNNTFRLQKDRLAITSLKEFEFGILIIIPIDTLANEFTCENITDKNKELLKVSIDKLNTPLNIDTLNNYIITNTSDSKEANALTKTTGEFSSNTKLLDCTESMNLNKSEIVSILLIEFFIFYSLIFIIFRGRILILKKYIHENF